MNKNNHTPQTKLVKEAHSNNSQETDTAEVTELLSKPEKSRPDISNCLICKSQHPNKICSYHEAWLEGAKAERERILGIMSRDFKCGCNVCVNHFEEITEGSTSA